MPDNLDKPAVGPAMAVGAADRGVELNQARRPQLPGRDIHHELRTELAAITLLSGNLDLLCERLDDEKRWKLIKDLQAHPRAERPGQRPAAANLLAPPAQVAPSVTSRLGVRPGL